MYHTETSVWRGQVTCFPLTSLQMLMFPQCEKKWTHRETPETSWLAEGCFHYSLSWSVYDKGYITIRLKVFGTLQCTKCFIKSPGLLRLTFTADSEGFPDGAVMKNPPASAGDAGDLGLIPGSGRSPSGGNGNPLQYSWLENPTDRGTWWAAVHGFAKS